jgi:hypothetical protein
VSRRKESISRTFSEATCLKTKKRRPILRKKQSKSHGLAKESKKMRAQVSMRPLK